MTFITACIIRTTPIIFVNFTILSICSLKQAIGNLIRTHMPLLAIVQDASVQLNKDVMCDMKYCNQHAQREANEGFYKSRCTSKKEMNTSQLFPLLLQPLIIIMFLPRSVQEVVGLRDQSPMKFCSAFILTLHS